MEHDIDIMIDDRASLREQLCEDNGRLKDKLGLEKGIAIIPQFTTLDTRRAIGSLDILSFIINISIGITSSIAANFIYSWLVANKVKRVRINTDDILILEDKDKTVYLITESLEKRNKKSKITSYDNPSFKRSRELAKKEINARMRGHRKALTDSINLDAMKMTYFYNCLERIGSLVDEKDRDLYYSTAFEIIPFGSFNAEVFFPASEPPFILLDSGSIDFIGNNCAFYTQLRSGGGNLSKQDVIDYIWASALIYFEKGDTWESRRNAIFAPKLNFSQIDPVLIPTALGYSLAQVLFILVHEIGHIILNANPDFTRETKNNLEEHLVGQFEEGMSDLLAFYLLLQFALTFRDKSQSIKFISGIDIGLSFMHLMQNAFPIYYDKDKRRIKINERPDHPIGTIRRDMFRKWIRQELEKVDKRLGDELLIEGHDFDSIMNPYIQAVLDGAKPSDNFQSKLRIAQDMYE